MKKREFLNNFLGGVGIGVGASIPGVSGGTIAVIFHAFERIVWSINNLFKHFKDAIKILLPVLLGVGCAMIPCIFIFDLAFKGCAFALVSIFAGFIIGSFTNVTKEVNDVKIKPQYIIALICTCLVAIGLGVASVLTGGMIDIAGHFENPEWWFYLTMIPMGMIAAMALVMPGISGSMILLILGFYIPLINNISRLIKGDFSNLNHTLLILVAFAIGVLIGFMTIAKFLSWLLAHHRHGTFFGIIGFIIGSTIALFFNNHIAEYYIEWFNQTDGAHWLPMYVEIPLGCILIGVSAYVSHKLLALAEKAKNKKENQPAE